MIFKKAARFGRNLFKKQATGVNKIFSKVAEGLDYIVPGKNLKAFINSPIADAIAAGTGTTNALNMVRTAIPIAERARDGARIGAEVGDIYGNIANKGLTKDVKQNTLERVAKLSADSMAVL